MKKFIFAVLVFVLLNPYYGQAAEENFELSIVEKKQILTEVAIDQGIPPEILKAIAYQESGMMQFDKEGNPLRNLNGDGGVGIMQVTDTEIGGIPIDLEKAAIDTRYNIETGARILNHKWSFNFIPKINEPDRSIIEQWYFPILAYNGLSKKNDPSFAEETYQQKVFEIIRNSSFLDINLIDSFEVEYPYENDLMVFPEEKRNIQWDGPFQTSTQIFNIGDAVFTFNQQFNHSNLREAIGGERIARLPHYTPLTIVSGPYHDTNLDNHFVFYEVEANDSRGYIASSNVRFGIVSDFKDIVQGTVLAQRISQLELAGIIKGHTDGTFRPSDPLLRRHVAAMLVNELQLKKPDGYVMKASDMKPGDIGYNEMLIAEAHGLMGAGGKLRPNEGLRRDQMASVLVNAYGDLYEQPTTNKVFSDIDETYATYEQINMLAYNGITVVEQYRPRETVTRSQFVHFLYNTISKR